MSKKSSRKQIPVETPKTPTQILNDLEKEKRAKEQRTFVKDVLYPFLLNNSKNVADAKTMLKATAIGIQQAFSNKITEEQQRVSKLPLSYLEMEKFVQKGTDSERFAGLLNLVKDREIAEVASLLDGMESTITGFEREESTKRGLDSLPATFLDPETGKETKV